MKVYPDTKIFIMSPSNYHTGGVELLHQLCSEMIVLGLDAYMYYYPQVEDPVDEFYRKYHVPYVTDIEDLSHNIIVVNETATQFLFLTQNMQRVLWWLSVDFYLNFLASSIYMHIGQGVTERPLKRQFVFTQHHDNIEHWVQSEYARQFVRINLGDDADIRMVGDYLNQEFLKEADNTTSNYKKNVVIYNPKKGLEYTSKLMAADKDFAWVPIENMTPAEVRQCMASAKVYVDFGNHPGKDRIPREAAISGCVIITGTQGAAANDIDINIGREFKFDERRCEISDVLNKIKFVMEHYEEEYTKQKSYRESIRGERERFRCEVAQALELSLPREDIALIAMPDECAGMIASLYRYKSRFFPRYIINNELATGVWKEESIAREHNVNFLLLPGGIKLECITVDDAAFLYKEERILSVVSLGERIGKPEQICNAIGLRERDLIVMEEC